MIRGFRSIGSRKKTRLRTVDLSNVKSLYEHYRMLIWFFSGIILASFVINLFCTGFYDRLGIYSEYFTNRVKDIQIDNKGLFGYCIWQKIKEIALILLLSFTSFGKLFQNLYCAYKGAIISFLICASVLKYGIGGVLIYLISIFPHYITYVALIVLVLFMGVEINENMKSFRKNRYMGVKIFDGIRQMILSNSGKNTYKSNGHTKMWLIIPIIVLLILITSYLEAYVNTSIMTNIL